MSDLTAFLNARMDEDTENCEPLVERLAQSGWENENDAWDEMGPSGVYEWETCRAAVRIMREVSAKRAILAEHYPEPRGDSSGSVDCGICWHTGAPGSAEPWPCPTVRALAAVYTGHPDYQQDWTGTEPQRTPFTTATIHSRL